MTDKTAKELSRRDALKLLGAAAGATVLANLPSKWSTPELTAGVLPAHAQTSAVLHSVVCDLEQLFGSADDPFWLIESRANIMPPAENIPMHYVIALDNLTFNPAHPGFGNVATDVTGFVSTGQFRVLRTDPTVLATATITWTFVDPADGQGDCSHEMPFVPDTGTE
jgi:hypothetical protein